MVRILLADDHKVVRQGLRALLDSEADFEVVGEAGDGLEAVRLVEQVKPDILVLDLMMGGITGLEVIRQVGRRYPHTGIVVLSMYGNESYVVEALRAGAKAYILKEAASDELLRAVREAAAGHHYLSPPLSERAIEAYVKKSEDAFLDPYEKLTSREREVLHLASQSCTNAEIAERLYISRRTVEVHRANMMQKLGLSTQAQLISYAIRKGILPPDNEPPLPRG